MVDCYVRFKGLIIHKSSVFVAWIVVSITASVEFWMKCVSNSSRFDVMNSPNNLLITPTNHVCCCVMKLGHKRLVVVWMDSQRSVLRQLWDEPMWSWKPRIQMQILEQNAVLGSTHQALSTVFGRSVNSKSATLMSALYCIRPVKAQHLQANSASRLWLTRYLTSRDALADGSDGTDGAIKIDEHRRLYFSIASDQ